jgi:hypothetical protein
LFYFFVRLGIFFDIVGGGASGGRVAVYGKYPLLFVVSAAPHSNGGACGTVFVFDSTSSYPKY